MRLTTAGIPVGLGKAVVGRITTTPKTPRDEHILLLATTQGSADVAEYRALLTPLRPQDLLGLEPGVPTVHSLRDYEHWRDEDIVILEPGGFVRTLYRPDSLHNTIFVTERCNSNCLMCSQPPKDHDDTGHFLAANLELIRLVSPGPETIGITGGEPTLLEGKLITLMSALRDQWPTTHVHILTNGRRFAWVDFTREFSAVNHPSTMLGIPLYADDPVIHDYVVQAKDAFDQTVIGMHQLARFGQQIELRVVLHQQTIARLVPLAHYVTRNLPFLSHVALMGLEPTGYTPRNRDKLWIDPVEYQDALEEAVEVLSVHGMNVSIYNHQLCLLRESLWGFARKSISDWKNVYLPPCQECGVLDKCGGLFASAVKFHSPYIRPLPAQ